MFPQDKVNAISSSLNKFGLKNPILKAGILSVVSTETDFNIRTESSYRATPNQRLRILFGRRLQKYNDDALTKLKEDDVAFFDAIYGGINGNLAVGDGFRYRGRGYNQITFKNLYQKYGTMIGVDLVTAPDRLDEPQIAADALAAYFFDGFRIGRSTLKDKYHLNDASLVNDLPTASKIAFQANAGWGINLDVNSALVAEHRKQLQNVDELYKML